MSTPHEYYDNCDNIEIDCKGNSALYEDVDAYANNSDASLPIPSTIGRGPRGDAYIPEIIKNTEDDFEFELRNNRLPDEYIKSPNLHAGKISVEVDPLPSNTNSSGEERGHLIWPSSDDEGQHVHFFNSRGGTKKEIATAVLPKGAHGTRIYTIKQQNPLPLSLDYTYTLLKSDLWYDSEGQYEDQPKPRIWDVVFASVKNPEDGKAYISAGLIVAVSDNDEGYVTVEFRNMFHNSNQEQANYLQLDPVDVSYIKNRHRIEDNQNKISSWNTSLDNIKYPGAKLVKDSLVDVEEDLATETQNRIDADNQLHEEIEDEAEAREQADTTEATTRATKDDQLDAAIQAEKTRAQGAESTLTANLGNEVQARTAGDADINSKIPAQASSTNQLADRNWVNSTVATETAHLITNNGQPFTDPTQLPSTGVTNNDYAYVIVVTDEKLKSLKPDTILKRFKEGKLNEDQYYFTRYKWSDKTTPVGWALEFTIRPGFTADQWAAINSGATKELIDLISEHETAIGTLETTVAGKQDALDTDQLAAVNSGATATKIGQIETNKENILNKLDKVTSTTTKDQAYGKKANGTATMFDVDVNGTADTVVRRNGTGQSNFSTPTSNAHAATKYYTDTVTANKLDMSGTGTYQGDILYVQYVDIYDNIDTYKQVIQTN